MKTNYFTYATIILSLVLVYVFGELKYEKKMAKTKELWLLNDTANLEEKIGDQEEVIKALVKQNKEYEIIIGIIKLNIAKDKEIKKEEPNPKANPQSSIPSVPKGYPGRYIPKGEIQNHKGLLKI